LLVCFEDTRNEFVITCNTNKVAYTLLSLIKHVISPYKVYLKLFQFITHKSTLNILKVMLYLNLITTKIHFVQN